MDASHERLAKSKEEYEKQTPLLTRSRRLLSKMSWHSLLESLILYGALAFFFLVVAFIIQKRLRYFVPSFLVPSFGKPHSKVPGQYPAGLQQGGLESPGRFADPSGSGSPSNDKWYEAQPGYDLPGDVNDDQWYQAQPDDMPGAFPHTQQQQFHDPQQQQDSALQQHQPQLEEAYREAVAQPQQPSPEPPGNSKQNGHSMPSRHVDAGRQTPSSSISSDADPAGSSAAAADLNEDLSTRLQPEKSTPVTSMPAAPVKTAVPPKAASAAELEIRQGLGIENMPKPSQAASDHQSPHGHLAGSQPTDPTDSSVSPQQPAADADAARGLETYPGLEKARHSETPQSAASAGQPVNDLPGDLATYPGLEKAMNPEASQITAPAAEGLRAKDTVPVVGESSMLDLEGAWSDGAFNGSIGKPASEADKSSEPDSAIAAGRNATTGQAAFATDALQPPAANGSDAAHDGSRAAFSPSTDGSSEAADMQHGAPIVSTSLGSSDDDVVEPGTPLQSHEAAVSRDSAFFGNATDSDEAGSWLQEEPQVGGSDLEPVRLSEPAQGQPGDSISEALALHEDLMDADALEARETAEAAGLGSGVDDVNAANGTTASGTGSNLTAAKMTGETSTRTCMKPLR